MKISKWKLGILFVLLIFIALGSYSVATYKATVLGETYKKDIIEKEIELEEKEAQLTQEEQVTLNLINEYRKQNGLQKLKPLSDLQSSAKLKAEDLVNSNYFSHNSPNLGTPFEMLENNEVEYAIAGENLAGNTTPDRAVEAWINSTSHRDNILEPKFTYTGICVIESKVYGRVFVQLFIGI